LYRLQADFAINCPNNINHQLREDPLFGVYVEAYATYPIQVAESMRSFELSEFLPCDAYYAPRSAIGEGVRVPVSDIARPSLFIYAFVQNS
jgi:hypothetical protein